jgi:hypothetical protein
MSTEPLTQDHPWETFVSHLRIPNQNPDTKSFQVPGSDLEIRVVPGTRFYPERDEIYIYFHDVIGVLKILIADKIPDSQTSALAFLNPSAPPAFIGVMPIGDFAAGEWFPLPQIRSGTRSGIIAEYINFIRDLPCWPALREYLKTKLLNSQPSTVTVDQVQRAR